MIPLVRPSFPDPETWLPRWKEATGGSNQYTNFGPLWKEAARRLSEETGRIAIPVSSGTEAVALAISAAAESLYLEDPVIYYEAFTFAATRAAAVRNGYAIAKRTDFVQDTTAIVVRTIPFGSARTIKSEPTGSLVIDAAGAFHPDGLGMYPKDAFIACSFHATKNFPIGEGGCVFLPPNAAWAERSVLSSMNFALLGHRNQYATNAKLDELHCAILLAQLDRKEYFADRSHRIRMASRMLALDCDPIWKPYDVGTAQSLCVVAHKEPDRFVAELAIKGFTAKRVYYPYISGEALTYDEARLVALPSDTTDDELQALSDAIKEIG